MTYEVVYSPLARRHLAELQAYISQRADSNIADRYVDAVIDHCEDLNLFPYRGTQRDDLRQGLRTISYRKRTVIAFIVDEDASRVVILAVTHGGQDYETIFTEEEPNS